MANRTVFVSGIFNIFHPGHLRLLLFARESGEQLIVGILSDRIAGKDAHVPENLRLEAIKNCSLVNEAFIINEPVIEVIARLRPYIVVKGKEHELLNNPELAVLSQYGGRLLFSSGETVFSSIDLIRKEFYGFDVKAIQIPHDYLNRHNIHKERLIFLLEQISKLKVCVIGDLIIDEYITCEPLGMSQEEPTIVVMPIDSKRYLGGAGIVAAHAVGLGASVKFFSVTGNDATRFYALDAIASARVDAQLLVDDIRPTSLKQRYRSKGKSLLRVSHLHQGAISLELQKQLVNAIEHELDSTNLLVFSDFNYGCLPQPLVEKLAAMARRRGVFLAADSQSSSQVGDISRFRGMNLITPTEREARISLRNWEDGLVILAELLRKQATAENVLLKLGEDGLMIHAGVTKDNDWVTDQVGALSAVVKDVAGAGDSLLITSAMTLACGGNIWEAACLGSLAAAIQVGRIGNIPISVDELLLELK